MSVPSAWAWMSRETASRKRGVETWGREVASTGGTMRVGLLVGVGGGNKGAGPVRNRAKRFEVLSLLSNRSRSRQSRTNAPPGSSNTASPPPSLIANVTLTFSFPLFSAPKTS